MMYSDTHYDDKSRGAERNLTPPRFGKTGDTKGGKPSGTISQGFRRKGGGGPWRGKGKFSSYHTDEASSSSDWHGDEDEAASEDAFAAELQGDEHDALEGDWDDYSEHVLKMI